KKRYLVRLSGNTLRFYIGDGWTEDLVQSMLATGEIRQHADFFHLAFTVPSSFDRGRLSDLCSDIQEGQIILSAKKREQALDLYGAHFPFIFGDVPIGSV